MDILLIKVDEILCQPFHYFFSLLSNQSQIRQYFFHIIMTCVIPIILLLFYINNQTDPLITL